LLINLQEALIYSHTCIRQQGEVDKTVFGEVVGAILSLPVSKREDFAVSPLGGAVARINQRFLKHQNQPKPPLWYLTRRSPAETPLTASAEIRIHTTGTAKHHRQLSKASLIGKAGLREENTALLLARLRSKDLL